MDLRLFLLSCDEIRHSNAWKVDAFEIDDIINTVQDKNLEKAVVFLQKSIDFEANENNIESCHYISKYTGARKHKT